MYVCIYTSYCVEDGIFSHLLFFPPPLFGSVCDLFITKNHDCALGVIASAKHVTSLSLSLSFPFPKIEPALLLAYSKQGDDDDAP